MAPIDPAVDRALSWLEAAQLPSGELPAWAGDLRPDPPTWAPDSLQFITALAALALDDVDDPRAAGIVDRAVGFLQREREPFDLWRYWSRETPQHAFTPPDADDTACASMAVARRGHGTDGNRELFAVNRDDWGRFRTWFVDRPGDRGPTWEAATAGERETEVAELRTVLWTTTEADPDDVDVVVNANVCRYLGPDAPAEAADWVVSIVVGGAEVGPDKWHRNRTSLYLAVADGARRGVPAFAAHEGTIVDRVTYYTDEGDISAPLDRAQALGAVQALGADARVRGELAASLRADQRSDGSWERSTFFYGGPRELVGWGSEALTTALAAAALHRERRP